MHVVKWFALAPVTVIGAVLLIRLPYLFTTAALNPDEAELLAQGRLAELDLAPSRTFGTTTYTSLTPMVLGLLARTGLPLTLSFAHVMAAVAAALILWMALYCLVASGVQPQVAVVSWFPMFAAVSLGGLPDRQPWDFISLSTGLLPVLLLFSALTLALLGRHRPVLMILGACAAGLAPWAKVQAIPLSLVVLAWICSRLWNLDVTRSRVRSVLFACLAFMLPTLSFVTAMAGFRTLDEFARETIGFTARYASSGTTKVAGEAILDRLFAGLALILSQPLLSSVVVILGMFALRSSRFRYNNFLALLALVIGFVTLAAPSQPFGHYLWFWIFAVLLCVCILLAQSQPLSARFLLRAFPGLATVALTTALAVLLVTDISRNIVSMTQGDLGSRAVIPEWAFTHDDRSQQISQLCPPTSRVLVWGWMPDYYSHFDWTPALRTPNTFEAIPPLGAGAEDTQRAVLAALYDPQTLCAVDAVYPGAFAFQDPTTQGITNALPGAREALSNYRRLSNPDGVADIWVRVR